MVNAQRDFGSIPACAGEARQAARGVGFVPVYPRVCGGSGRLARQAARGVGLSPRVRGKRAFRISEYRRAGSIPACAGEASANHLMWFCISVYPRVCGGSIDNRAGTHETEGLSPRVRGKRDRPARNPGRLRSIPACAGEAANSTANEPAKGVYPRVCGGSPITTRSTNPPRGLSPRVRGKRRRPDRYQRITRSIPACAGEARAAPPRKAAGAVYPRVCGGSAFAGRHRRPVNGLSPRVRGKHAQAERHSG